MYSRPSVNGRCPSSLQPYSNTVPKPLYQVTCCHGPALAVSLPIPLASHWLLCCWKCIVLSWVFANGRSLRKHRGTRANQYIAQMAKIPIRCSHCFWCRKMLRCLICMFVFMLVLLNQFAAWRMFAKERHTCQLRETEDSRWLQTHPKMWQFLLMFMLLFVLGTEFLSQGAWIFACLFQAV